VIVGMGLLTLCGCVFYLHYILRFIMHLTYGCNCRATIACCMPLMVNNLMGQWPSMMQLLFQWALL